MIHVRQFRASDFAAFDPIEPLSRTQVDDPEFAQAIEDSGLAVTGIRNGRVVGCAGVHPINETTGEIWIRISKESLTFPTEMLWLLRDGFKIIEETYPFEVLTASVKCSLKSSVSMIEKFGFEFTQNQTIDGEQWAIYSKRIKSEQYCKRVS